MGKEEVMNDAGDEEGDEVEQGDEDESILFEKRNVCKMCKKEFKKSSNLKRHMDNVHVKNVRRKSESREETKVENKYTCETCKKDFKRIDNLGRHMKNVHGGEKRNTDNHCKGCKKQFVNKTNVLRHMATRYHHLLCKKS